MPPRAVSVAGLIIGGLVVTGIAVVSIGAYTWRRATNRRFDALTDRTRASSTDDGGGGEGRGGGQFTRAQLRGLPEPVARYLAFALPEGQHRIRAARIRWAGDMKLQPTAGWTPFTADQRFSVSPPGFVWDARVRMAPLVPVFVRDSYLGGEGEMLGRVGAVVNVVHQGGTPAMALGALARWLGEAAWFPTAFLSGEGLAWATVDDSTARATLTDGAVHVSADFHFAPTGELTSMSAMRYRDVGGRNVLTPFEGRYARYERRNGVMIPASAEVAWLLPQGRYTYWRGRPAEVSYDLALTRASR